MAAIRSFGIKVKIATSLVGGLTDVKIPGTEVAVIDITDHDSTSGFREKMGGLKDSGEITLSGNFKRGDVGQVYIQSHPGETAAFDITMSNGDKFAGNAVIGAFELSNPQDDKVTFSTKLSVTGAVTYTAGA